MLKLKYGWNQEIKIREQKVSKYEANIIYFRFCLTIVLYEFQASCCNHGSCNDAVAKFVKTTQFMKPNSKLRRFLLN